jgi:hypothetical protein
MNANTDRTNVLCPAAVVLFAVLEVVGLTRLREMAG